MFFIYIFGKDSIIKSKNIPQVSPIILRKGKRVVWGGGEKGMKDVMVVCKNQ